jgi:hypothetical protein
MIGDAGPLVVQRYPEHSEGVANWMWGVDIPVRLGISTLGTPATRKPDPMARTVIWATISKPVAERSRCARQRRSQAQNP